MSFDLTVQPVALTGVLRGLLRGPELGELVLELLRPLPNDAAEFLRLAFSSSSESDASPVCVVVDLIDQ